MPTYEYECTSCGKVFELFQPITEPPRKRLRKTDPKPCKCNAPVLRRISRGGGLIFKGSGFYITDYRSDSYKNAAKSESEGASKSSTAKTDGKGESVTTDKAASSETKSTSKPDAGSAKPSKKSKSGRGHADV